MARIGNVCASVALVGTLLWGSDMFAAPGGFPACMAGLNACSSSLSTCNNSLSSCDANLTVAQACGNGVIDPGEQCDQSNLNGQTCATQGFAAGVLKCGAGCMFDTSGCSANRFIDNGDGTVSDLQTGLMWEKKDNLDLTANFADPHDADNTYTLSASGTAADGTAYTDFLAKLDNGASADGGASTPITGCFAGHCDWRLPTIVELQGIVDATQGVCGGGSGACIDSAFGPTRPFYWSATTSVNNSGDAYGVVFNDNDGSVRVDAKASSLSVRAVRGGS